jgi:hypothetical protein
MFLSDAAALIHVKASKPGEHVDLHQGPFAFTG